VVEEVARRRVDAEAAGEATVEQVQHAVGKHEHRASQVPPTARHERGRGGPRDHQ
jgi:hypothetical protein